MTPEQCGNPYNEPMVGGDFLTFCGACRINTRILKEIDNSYIYVIAKSLVPTRASCNHPASAECGWMRMASGSPLYVVSSGCYITILISFSIHIGIHAKGE
jgi:hypothetical protein